MKYENKRVLRKDTKKALKYIEDMRPNSVPLFNKAFSEEPNLYLSYVIHFIESERKGKKYSSYTKTVIFDDLENSIKQMNITFIKRANNIKQARLQGVVDKINDFLIYITMENIELDVEESYQIETLVSTYNREIDPDFDELNALKYLTNFHDYVFNLLLQKHQRKLREQEQTTQSSIASLTNNYEN